MNRLGMLGFSGLVSEPHQAFNVVFQGGGEHMQTAINKNSLHIHTA